MFRCLDRRHPNRALLTLACLACAGASGCGGSGGRDGEVVARARPAAEDAAPGTAGTPARTSTATVGVVTQAGSGVLVDVAGAVRRPGVYRLGPGARVLDAITAAGGARAGAQLASLNRAAPVVDGQQVVVPDGRAGAAGLSAGGAVGAGAGAAAGGGSTAARVSLGSATVADLDGLPGIGPVTAAKIVGDRSANGAFASVDDLDRVPGIGPAMVEQLRELVTP